jgi:Cu+-exporting ATPase
LAEIACSHCNLIFPEEVMLTEKTTDNRLLHFCCNGCQGVYHLLHNESLDTFYTKRGKTQIDPVKHYDQAVEKFDLEGFENRYVTLRNDGLKEINLIIEGIHCAACVWLNEKILHKQEGIIEATINYTNNKAKVVWNPQEIALSQIIVTIRSIGYNAHPYDPKLQEEHARKTKNTYYIRILVALFGTMNIMWLAIAHYAGYFSGIEQGYKNILNVAEFILATPVLFYSGSIFFKGAYYGYKNRVVNMDTLVASGASLSYFYSIYAMITQHGEVYFDSVVMIITFVLVGKYLEIVSKKQAVDTLDTIMGAIPTEVTQVVGSAKKIVSVDEIKTGDILELKAGEKVVIDGILLKGEASFDESPLTGESEAVLKQANDEILSGSICLDTTLHYQATKDASHSLLSSIVSLLETSLVKKPKVEQLANSISGYFSNIILLIALLTFVGWYLSTNDFEQALIISISVIVIACPCALGLATPMASLVGIGVAAKRGILFKEASFLEQLAKVDTIALDKTGTLTEGKLSVTKETTHQTYDSSLLLALVENSTHPVAKGIQHYLEGTGITSSHTLSTVKTLQAKGLQAETPKHDLRGGNATFLKESGTVFSEAKSDATHFYFAVDHNVVATFELQDTIKQKMKESIQALQERGLQTMMLTGDHEKSAKRVADALDIQTYHASLLPTQKAEMIDALHQKNHTVLMVGDGINDAISLAKSDVAIAMGKGTDVAIEVSDVVLLDESAPNLLNAHLIAKRTYRAIQENLGFSLLYNVVTVPLAVMGFVNPLVAALSMSLSSLIVVLNSMRIKQVKLKGTTCLKA